MIKNQRGQSLIEALIALGSAVIIVAAITIAVITSVNNTDFSKNQNLATQYAQQGMELLRHKSEADWALFATLSGDYCLDEGKTTLVNAGFGCTPNIKNANSVLYFVRSVNISQNNAVCRGGASVSVSVSWNDGKCTNQTNKYCHSTKLDSCLTNINSVPTT